MHNPFRRAARNGAPDMRVTAPLSAEMPMPGPTDWGSLASQLTEARRQNNAMNVEVAKLMGENDRLRHRINAAPNLLAALDHLVNDGWLPNPEARMIACTAIAQAKGETEPVRLMPYREYLGQHYPDIAANFDADIEEFRNDPARQ